MKSKHTPKSESKDTKPKFDPKNGLKIASTEDHNKKKEYLYFFLAISELLALAL